MKINKTFLRDFFLFFLLCLQTYALLAVMLELWPVSYKIPDVNRNSFLAHKKKSGRDVGSQDVKEPVVDLCEETKEQGSIEEVEIIINIKTRSNVPLKKFSGKEVPLQETQKVNYDFESDKTFELIAKGSSFSFEEERRILEKYRFLIRNKKMDNVGVFLLVSAANERQNDPVFVREVTTMALDEVASVYAEEEQEEVFYTIIINDETSQDLREYAENLFLRINPDRLKRLRKLRKKMNEAKKK